MNIKTITLTHELNTPSEKKFLTKLADKDYRVKLIFKEGIYDNEMLVKGFDKDVSAFSGYFKVMRDIKIVPKTLTRSFPTSK